MFICMIAFQAEQDAKPTIIISKNKSDIVLLDRFFLA